MDQNYHLAQAMMGFLYEQGEVVFQKGMNLSNKLCIVLEGNLYDKTRNQINAKRNEILFEKEISNNENTV